MAELYRALYMQEVLNEFSLMQKLNLQLVSKTAPNQCQCRRSEEATAQGYKSGECWRAKPGPMFLDFSSRMVPGLTPTHWQKMAPSASML